MAEAAVADAPQTDAPAATEAAPAAEAVTWAPDPRLAPPAATPPAQAEPPAAEVAPSSDPEPPGAAAPAAEAPDWKAKLDEGDADLLKELLSHPKIAGHVGTLADRIAAQKAAKAEQDARDAALDRAAQEDPDNPLAQERLNQRRAEQQQLAEATAKIAGFSAAQEGVAAFVTSLPDEARAEIAKLAPEGKAYGEPGDLKSGLIGYMKDVVAGAIAADRVTQRAAWEKDILPGLRKEVQAELMGADRSPDLGTAAQPAGSGASITLEQVGRMSAAEFNKFINVPANKAAYDALWGAMGKK